MSDKLPIFVPQRSVSWQSAQAAVVAAVEKAEAMGIRINVSVADVGGNEVAFLRMPGAFIHSIDIAKDKAYTAVSFGFPTSAWEEIFSQEEMLKVGMPHRDRLVVFGGGLPIRVEDELIGGIGVSGGTAEEDEVCAEAGISAILELCG